MTSNPSLSLSAPLDLSEENTINDIMVNDAIPTIQQLISSDPTRNSIVVNFSTTSNIEAEYDEESQELSIVITAAEPTMIPEEIPEEEEEESNNDNGDNGGNDNGNSGGGSPDPIQEPEELEQEEEVQEEIPKVQEEIPGVELG